MGTTHTSPTVGVISTPNPGMYIGAISTPNPGMNIGAISTPSVGMIQTPTVGAIMTLQNLSLYADLYNPQPVTITTSTSSHSGSTMNYQMPTVNSATDMHSGSHSQFTTVTAPTIDQNYVDLSGTRNSGTQIFGLQNLLYVARGGSVYAHKP